MAGGAYPGRQIAPDGGDPPVQWGSRTAWRQVQRAAMPLTHTRPLTDDPQRRVFRGADETELGAARR